MKTVLVTGAGRGLGLALVREHLQRGDKVFALEYKMSDTLCEMAKEDSRVVALVANIGSTESVDTAIKQVAEQTDALDVIYNNAGIYYPLPGFREEGRRELLEYDLDKCMDMYNINALGALRVAKAALKYGLLHSGATICNTSSEAGSIEGLGTVRRAYEYNYCMSKAALNKGSEILYNDVERQGMRVILIHPGWMATDMGGAQAKQDPADTAQKLAEMTDDFHSTSRENWYLKFDGTPIPW